MEYAILDRSTCKLRITDNIEATLREMFDTGYDGVETAISDIAAHNDGYHAGCAYLNVVIEAQ